MVRVDEITKEKAKFLKQARLTGDAQAALAKAKASGAFAGRHAWEADHALPVLRLAEEVGCNSQIAELLVLTDGQNAPVAVVAIDDKWIGPAVDGATIYFGGKVSFF